MGNSHSGTIPAHRPPPPMAHKNSSESSISLDSFIHLVASSQESLTTAPPPSHRENSYSSWSQGVRQPPETVSSQYRNPHIFNYDLPPRDMPGPAGYRPSLDPGLSQKLPASVKPISRPFKGPPPPHFSGDSLTQKVYVSAALDRYERFLFSLILFNTAAHRPTLSFTLNPRILGKKAIYDRFCHLIPFLLFQSD